MAMCTEESFVYITSFNAWQWIPKPFVDFGSLKNVTMLNFIFSVGKMSGLGRYDSTSPSVGVSGVSKNN